ncbi:hypothetical protein HMPREF0762_01145 [Slackia exigua ATCC 700122]|uniref:Uncharacterized protein n=1 Tax=Slackia exigua (strain ATCC 700122 / DSM 15923 / CIP 105133 / JCM 11022 / KCTC 5966 / S-7) TaxID=649764 RepID=D0WHB2_SLAES|nr:hypothetical protein HMPREF0762_01145 [Slackia exigua ATCC 700122]
MQSDASASVQSDRVKTLSGATERAEESSAASSFLEVRCAMPDEASAMPAIPAAPAMSCRLETAMDGRFAACERGRA